VTTRRLALGIFLATGAIGLVVLINHSIPDVGENASQTSLTSEIEGFRRRTTNGGGFAEYIHERTGIIMVLIGPGSSATGQIYYDLLLETDEHPAERAKVRDTTFVPAFLIAKYELSQQQWNAIMGDKASDGTVDELPAAEVSPAAATEFCKRTGLHIPTLDQWVRAASPSDYESERPTLQDLCRRGAVNAGLPITENNVKDGLWPATRGIENRFGVVNAFGNVGEIVRLPFKMGFFRDSFALMGGGCMTETKFLLKPNTVSGNSVRMHSGLRPVFNFQEIGSLDSAMSD